MNKSIKTITMILSVGLLFSACTSQKDIMLKQGYNLSYANGFDDGCHSGNAAGGSMFDTFKKDTNKFGKDNQYSQGWSDGFRQCEYKQEAIQRQVRIGIEQQKLREQKKMNTSIKNNYLLDHSIKYNSKLLNNLK